MLSSVLMMAGAGIPASDKTVEIAPGVNMPKINLGTCCGSQPSVGLKPWLDAGGVGIDTAYDYKDQVDIQKVLAGYPVKREDLFILSKIPAGLGIGGCTGGATTALNRIQDDLQQLNTTYIDLVLLHAPCLFGGKKADQALWSGMEQALKQGLVKAIGVSNYKQSDIEGLMETATVTPALNQCSMSVNTHDDATINYCKSKGITYEAYDVIKGCPMDNAAVTSAATAHNVSAAQVCLRYILDSACVAAAGTGADASTVGPYAKENVAVYDFKLTAEEMKALDAVQSA